MDIEAPEIGEFARRINFSLVGGLALAHHRGRIHPRPIRPRKKVRCFENNGTSVFDAHLHPAALYRKRVVDGLCRQCTIGHVNRTKRLA